MKYTKLLPLLFLLSFALNAQERPLNIGLSLDEQYSFIGLTLAELIERFGPPRTVFAARGNEIWQDDVVFQYTSVDFYIFRDRVWQVRFASTHNIANGDSKTNVLWALGSRAQDWGAYILMPITDRDWPLTLRVNFNASAQVSAIFLYRSDF